MERNNEFNIRDQTDYWVSRIKSEPSVTESDAEELKSHLLDIIDQLKEAGLDNEEAFLVATRRMGTIADWEEDYSQVNKPVIQMRRSVLILAGVLVYFLLYLFIEFTSRLIFIILLSRDINGYLAANWVSRYLISVHFVVILFFVGIFFHEKIVISFFENFRLKPLHTILLLLTTIIFGIINTCLLPVAKNLTDKDYALRDDLIHIYIYFYYSFPLLMCLGFILIYFKYHKTAKI